MNHGTLVSFLCVLDVYFVLYLDSLILCFILCTMVEFDHMMVKKLLNGESKGRCY